MGHNSLKSELQQLEIHKSFCGGGGEGGAVVILKYEV